MHARAKMPAWSSQWSSGAHISAYNRALNASRDGCDLRMYRPRDVCIREIRSCIRMLTPPLGHMCARVLQLGGLACADQTRTYTCTHIASMSCIRLSSCTRHRYANQHNTYTDHLRLCHWFEFRARMILKPRFVCDTSRVHRPWIAIACTCKNIPPKK